MNHIVQTILVFIFLNTQLLSQHVTWIHPVNVNIENARITSTLLGHDWNSGATSLEQLESGNTGTISFHVPSHTHQMFYIGFAQGCNNPFMEEAIIGLSFQQQESGGMTANLHQGILQLPEFSRDVNAGDKIDLSFQSGNYKISVNNSLLHSGIVLYAGRPVIAKASFKFGSVALGKAYVENIRLVGEWSRPDLCEDQNDGILPLLPADVDVGEMYFPLDIPNICKYITSVCDDCFSRNFLCEGSSISFLSNPRISKIELIKIDKGQITPKPIAVAKRNLTENVMKIKGKISLQNQHQYLFKVTLK